MKKVSTVILCLVMLLSLTTTAVFAAYDYPEENVPVVFSEGDNDYVVPYLYYSYGYYHVYFYPEVSGVYTFTCTDPDGGLKMGPRVGGDFSDYFIGGFSTFENTTFEYTLTAGEAVQMCFYNCTGQDETISFNLSIDAFEDQGPEKTQLSMGDNEISVPSGENVDCVFKAESEGTYILTLTDENGYINVDGVELMIDSVMSTEFKLVAGQPINIQVGTYDWSADDISFHIALEGAVDTELEEGDNDVFIPVDNLTYGLDCTFDVPRNGVYTFTVTGENAKVYIQNTLLTNGSTLDVELKEGRTLEIDVLSDADHGDHVYINILWKEDYVEHVHAYSIEGERKEPTCSEQGYSDMVCECGDIDRTILSKLEHTPAAAVKENEVAPGCTTDGSYDMVIRCSVCQAEISRETTTVSAKGHTAAAAVRENEVAATCTTDGSYQEVVYCSVCGAEMSRNTVTVKATGHAAGEAVKENEVPATCADDGSYDLVVYCTVCNAEMSRESQVVQATGDHVYATQTDRKEPTCTDDGYVIMACGCGAEEKTTLKASGHTAAEAVKEKEVAATCTTNGSYDTVVYCSTCGAEMSRETTTVKATGHDHAAPVQENVVNATCSSDGSYDLVVYCKTCNAEISRENKVVVATGDHVYATQNERQEPTCTEDGYVIMACGCGATETTTLTATGHAAAEAVKQNEIAATCTVDGSYDMVVLCSVCGAEMDRETIAVPATGEHVYAAETERKDATCTEAGFVIMACGCGETQTTELPIIDHTAAEAVKENETAATCTAEGAYDNVVYCQNCQTELSRETISVPMTEHTYGEWTTTKEPTATEDGVKTRTCVCGAEETEAIPALGVEPTEPQPTDPKPTDPKPTDPKPTESQPATQPSDSTEPDSNNTGVIIAVVVAVVVIGGVVALLVIKKKK